MKVFVTFTITSIKKTSKFDLLRRKQFWGSNYKTIGTPYSSIIHKTVIHVSSFPTQLVFCENS